MKKYILSLLVSINISTLTLCSNVKTYKDVITKEQEYSLLILFVDKNNNYNLVSFLLNNIKKTEFPTGPIIKNNISDKDLIKLSEFSFNKIRDLLTEKKAIKLPIFCINSLPNNKSKICGFELPIKEKLCYVFDFDSDVKKTEGVIVLNKEYENIKRLVAAQNIQINSEKPDEEDQQIDKATDESDDKYDENDVPPPAPYYKVKLREIAVCLFLKYLDVKESIINSYNNFINYFKKTK